MLFDEGVFIQLPFKIMGDGDAQRTDGLYWERLDENEQDPSSFRELCSGVFSGCTRWSIFPPVCRYLPETRPIRSAGGVEVKAFAL